ncbi:MAG: ribosome recycling factor [Rikenellaceae bacterium]|nr:ribosome recycling factor [Rikenellaceae bacterium]
MESKEILTALEGKMQKSLSFLQESLLNIRAGKANVNMLNGITVESYGAEMPVNQVASVTVHDAKTVLIQPWDKNVIAAIEKAIINANIGVTPSNNGESIRLNIPPLTEERRKQLVKQVKTEGENAKVSIRTARRDAVEAFKKAQKDGMAEDIAKDGENEAQKITDKYNKLIDAELDKKETEIMTV